MDAGEKVALTGLGVAVVAIGAVWAMGGTAEAATPETGPGASGPGLPSPDELATQPGFLDAEGVLQGLAGTPEQGAPPPAAATALCTIATLVANHLRRTATATLSPSDPSYPAGTQVEVLARTGISSRNASPLYHVQVVSDGARGYMFLSSAETASCPQQ